MRNILKFLFFVGIVSSLSAQTSVKDLKQQIAKVKKEIADQENKSQQEAQRDAEYKKLANSRLLRLNQQIASVKLQKDSLASELNKLKASARKAKGASFWYDKKRSNFSQFLAIQIDSLVIEFKSQFPYELEVRIESLESIATRLRAQNIQPEEALDRVWTILAESIKTGYEVESWKGSLEQPSGQLQGEYLRIGNVFQYFLVEKSDAVYAMNFQNNKWQWVSMELSLEERNYLRQALKVKAGQAAPEMVRLPIPLNMTEAKTQPNTSKDDAQANSPEKVKSKPSPAKKQKAKNNKPKSKKKVPTSPKKEEAP